MNRGFGRIIAACLAIGAVIVGFTIAKHSRLAKRMVPVAGTMELEANGQSKISYKHGRVGTSKAATYQVTANYSYVVNGNTYPGKHIRLRGNSFASKEEAVAVVDRFKHANAVTVWYDPANPLFAVLMKPELDSSLLIALLILIALSIASYFHLDRAFAALRSLGRKPQR